MNKSWEKDYKSEYKVKSQIKMSAGWEDKKGTLSEPHEITYYYYYFSLNELPQVWLVSASTGDSQRELHIIIT